MKITGKELLEAMPQKMKVEVVEVDYQKLKFHIRLNGVDIKKNFVEVTPHKFFVVCKFIDLCKNTPQ